MKNTDEVQKLEFTKAVLLNALFAGISLTGTAIIFLIFENSLLIYACAITVATLINLAVSYCYAFTRLKKVTYSYGNLYLFRRYAFLYEAFFAVSLSFMLGAFPALFDYLQYTNSTVIFWINISLIWVGTNAAGAKCIIDYMKTIWEEEAKKRGDVLVG